MSGLGRSFGPQDQFITSYAFDGQKRVSLLPDPQPVADLCNEARHGGESAPSRGARPAPRETLSRPRRGSGASASAVARRRRSCASTTTFAEGAGPCTPSTRPWLLPNSRLTVSASPSTGQRRLRSASYGPPRAGATCWVQPPRATACESHRSPHRLAAEAALRPEPRPLPDGPFHLDLDQPVHLDCVFEWELFDDRLDEAGDDHRRGFGFGQSA